MNRYKPVGWRYESHKHSLAAKGIKTRYDSRKYSAINLRDPSRFTFGSVEWQNAMEHNINVKMASGEELGSAEKGSLACGEGGFEAMTSSNALKLHGRSYQASEVMEQKNVSSLELLNDTAKHIYGKHYIELSDYETSSVNMRISQVFREHKGEKISYKKWFEYLDSPVRSV